MTIKGEQFRNPGKKRFGKSLVGDGQRVKKQADDYQTQDPRADPDHLVNLIVLLGETFAGGVKTSASTLFQLVEFYTALHYHRLIHWLFRGCRRRVRFQPHFDLAQTQNLSGFQDGFGYFFAVNKGAIGGIEITHNHLGPAQKDFAVMARN